MPLSRTRISTAPLQPLPAQLRRSLATGDFRRADVRSTTGGCKYRRGQFPASLHGFRCRPEGQPAIAAIGKLRSDRRSRTVVHPRVKHRSVPVRSMLSSSQRMAVSVHRRETLGWSVLLSLALHLTLFLSLLIVLPTQPRTSGSEPLTVAFLLGGRAGRWDVGAASPDGGNGLADRSGCTGSAS